MRLFFLILFFTGGLQRFLIAQVPPDPIVVGKFWVSGNAVTDSWVIEREIPFAPGDTISAEDLQFAISRIEATTLFNRVEVIPYPGFPAGTTDLEFRVTESIYLIPYPVLDFVGGRFEDYNLGAGVVHRNFRGNAEILAASGWFGYSPGFSLYYENPWVGRESRHYFSAEISRVSFPSRSLQFEAFNEQWWRIQVFVKKYLTRYFYAGVGATENHIQFDTDQPVNPGGASQFWFFSPFTEISYDNRDFAPYAHKGFFLKYRLTKNGIANPEINNWTVSLDNRYFYKLGDRYALAFNNLHQLTLGSEKLFQLNYFGYDYRIRGYFYDTFESKNISLNQVEYRFPISKIWYINTGMKNDMTGDATENLKFGFSGTVFLVHGINWNTLSDLRMRKIRTGFGAGLNVIIPYIEAVRLELTGNDEGVIGGLLALGISF